MIELLRQAAAEMPDQLAVAAAERETTYAELARDAETAAGELRRRGIERFAVHEDDVAQVWALIAGAALAGAEPCVYPLAADGDAVANLRSRLGHATLVSTTGVADDALDPRELTGAVDVTVPDQPPAESRMLILTSGTSGKPQAAQHEWSRLLRATRRIEPTPEQRWLLAYGLNQFGALQILLHVASARATLVAGDSLQPRDALTAMQRWQVTHASGTPTFWRFLLAELRADDAARPPLRQVTLGGEAVPSALLTSLRETFPDARISQIYGATEMGQNITVRDGLPGLPMSVLDGEGDVVFRIIDGELWVRSRASMLGYYDEEPLEDGAWRATGDLVEVVGDRIMFRGRRTEIINVGGVKIHPLPIEERVSRVPGVALVHAYGRPSRMVGNIVALDVVPVAGADQETLRAAIRDACEDLPPAARPRSITFVDQVETSGNKVARGQRPARTFAR